MDAAERAHKLVTDQGDYTKRRVTLAESAIIQAEQAARQDERRKVLEAVERIVKEERPKDPLDEPAVYSTLGGILSKLRALAEEVM